MNGVYTVLKEGNVLLKGPVSSFAQLIERTIKWWAVKGGGCITVLGC